MDWRTQGWELSAFYAAIWGSIFQAPQASLKSCWPGNLNRATPQQGMMESFEESSAAKHQRLTRRDMQQTMQTGGPSSAKIEFADGADAKKEKRAEQEVKFEGEDEDV